MRKGKQKTVRYQYDRNGLRVRKESHLGVMEYVLTGKKLAHMTRKAEGATEAELHFYYHETDKPSVCVYNGKRYGYVYNAMGDVMALADLNNSGHHVVTYAYDAWGKQLRCTGDLAETLGAENPFRYRGYIYDEETGLYYLRTRYYNPEWGRFVNADGLLMRNLFAYCANDPVRFADTDGQAVSLSRDGGGSAKATSKPTPAKPKESKGTGGVTVTGTNNTVTIYGPYAETIAERLSSPGTTYQQSDCQNEVRLVLSGNELHNGSGGMWKKNVLPNESAQVHDLVFSNCPEAKHARNLAAEGRNNCKTYADDHKGHVGLVVLADWHDGLGPVLSVFQSCASGTVPEKSLWENDVEGGPNLTGFSEAMIYFGTIKPEAWK